MQLRPSLQALLDEAINKVMDGVAAIEDEACAKIALENAEARNEGRDHIYFDGWRASARDIATKIQARSRTK